MKEKLTQFQRLLVALIYIILLMVLYTLLGGRIFDITEETSIWFYSGALLIILGSYVTEPYFTKPTDSIANSISAFLGLLIVVNKENLFGYYYILYFSIAIFIISILTIILKDKFKKVSRVTYWFVSNFGSAKFIFSLIYLSSAYSFFSKTNLGLFVIAIALLVCILFFDFAGKLLKKIYHLVGIFEEKKNIAFLGRAIANKDFYQYTIEVENKSLNVKIGDIIGIRLSESYHIGILVNEKHVLDNIWVDVNLLYKESGDALSLTTKEMRLGKGNSILVNNLEAILINEERFPDEIKNLIKENKFYRSKADFIGYIEGGSDINTINFSIINNGSSIKEGTIIETDIFDTTTLFQVINGITREEREGKNSTSGSIKGIARKIGYYNYDNEELDIIKWVPQIYQPIYLHNIHVVCNEELNQIAARAIGRLPDTNMSILIKDLNSLVTHGTAILGILGIGKSCLTFELIKKIADQNIKIICIDITNQYFPELSQYMAANLIKNDLDDGTIALLRTSSTRTGLPPLRRNNPRDWGNTERYAGFLDTEIRGFLQSEQKVFIMNPENHVVTKPAGNFNIEELDEVTTTEKTQIISEQILKYYKNIGITTDARCLIVYEEAHSLIPEATNLSSNEKYAVSGTSRVILQGRKYGLGCCVVTQRTANVTKSILNQCNTVFALRVFDDTGKSFLENYLGHDYSELLPVLEERNAIIIGKGFRLKQPVIIQLNDRNCFLNRQNNTR